MIRTLRFSVVGLLLTGAALSLSEGAPPYSVGGSEHCMSCHDFGPESPVHKLQSGSHATAGEAWAELARRGCEGCHGPSGGHAGSPRQVSPAVSFGPRWTATTGRQDGACLACHEDNVAAHWKDSMHMVNNVTCVTCHDIHTGGDRVMFPSRQAEVCTICHKAQKKGIHGLAEQVALDPHCSSCHNPHDHESAETEMLGNRSAGCRTCHDLVAMVDSADVSEKATNYHKVMASADRTCLECHSGIAHAATDSVTAFAPQPGRRKEITLFYPGNTDSQWLFQQHPGSQPLRQGSRCQQCHRGEQAAMGQSLAGGFEPAARPVDVAFERDADSLRISLSWRGERDDKILSMMWGKDGNEAFQRGGCFAACHNDMTDMPGDRGQQTSKYLATSREPGQVGRPAAPKDQAALVEMMEQGQFVVMWRIELNTGKAAAAILLDKLNWQSTPSFRASTGYSNGRWQVDLRYSLTNRATQIIPFDIEARYTFGMAINGADNPGAGHWVSLPLTVRNRGGDSDFVME